MFSDFVHFSSPEIKKELPSDLSAFIHSGEVVKHNPVREVFKSAGYFIKLDYRKFHTFTHEFNIAQALNRAGIPVVEHLAYGRLGNENFLITRELAYSVTVEEFLSTATDTKAFLNGFTDLMTLWQNSNFVHTDPHFGNLLRTPASSLPVLVDVHDVKRRIFPWRKRSDISRFIFNLRGRIEHSAILELFAKFNIAEPEKLFDSLLTEEIIRLKSEWDKRRRQLFNAYPKFSVQQGKYLVASAYIQNFESLPDEYSSDAGKLFAASFFLSLFQIPHRRCIAFNRENNTVKFEAPLSGTPDAAACSVLKKQLALCGFAVDAATFRLRKNLAALNDISQIAVSPLFELEG